MLASQHKIHRLIKTQIGHARDFTWYRGQRPSPARVILSHERVQIHARENLCSYATNPPHFHWVVIVRHFNHARRGRALAAISGKVPSMSGVWQNLSTIDVMVWFPLKDKSLRKTFCNRLGTGFWYFMLKSKIKQTNKNIKTAKGGWKQSITCLTSFQKKKKRPDKVWLIIGLSNSYSSILIKCEESIDLQIGLGKKH